jgi:glycine dehydrogenase subunit 1
MDDGNADVAAVADLADEETLLVYAENPTVRGAIEERLSALGDVADDNGALFCVGSDVLALSLLEEPAGAGADVVVGAADALGMPTSYGMGLGLFATREEFLRQVPGRLVGAGEDAAGRRAYTLTLQTREQHIRKERATSNICTNQAWVALRTAMHAAWLGPDGLVDLAQRVVRDAADLAERLDAVSGLQAPVHDRHHFREFVVHTDQPAPAIRADLESRGYGVHAIDDHHLQVCVTDVTRDSSDGLVAALEEVA